MTDDTTAERRRGVRFFWAWLILATGASVAGNVAHALLAAAHSPTVAAAAAVVPPAVLLGSTHGVAVLVRTRTVGATYWSALALTVALAGCAFVLSFDALRTLAVQWAGIPCGLAWLWPISIDCSIAQSTLALLALTGRATRSAHSAPEHAPMHGEPRNGAAVNGAHPKHSAILSEAAAGTAPSTIARKLNVGYSTVGRILDETRQPNAPESLVI